MLFLSERPAIRGAERASEAGERTWEAEALIKEARRRRRRRWIGGTLAVLIAAAGATTWILLDGPAGPRAQRTAPPPGRPRRVPVPQPSATAPSRHGHALGSIRRAWPCRTRSAPAATSSPCSGRDTTRSSYPRRRTGTTRSSGSRNFLFPPGPPSRSRRDGWPTARRSDQFNGEPSAADLDRPSSTCRPQGAGSSRSAGPGIPTRSTCRTRRGRYRTVPSTWPRAGDGVAAECGPPEDRFCSPGNAPAPRIPVSTELPRNGEIPRVSGGISPLSKVSPLSAADRGACFPCYRGAAREDGG